jgi:hypothetical protein
VAGIIKPFYGRVVSQFLCYCQSLFTGMENTLAFSANEIITAVENCMKQVPEQIFVLESSSKGKFN